MIYSEKAIKAAVSSFPPEAWTSTDKQESKMAELVSQVSWLYSVEHWRAGAMAGLPIELQRNGDMIERADWPVDMNLPDLLYRYSLAMDLYGAAYLFQVMQGAAVVEVKWFDPQTIDIEANGRVGLIGFTRTLGAAKTVYPVKDGRSRVMWTWLPGMAEIGPGDPPANVVKDAAETLRYMSKTTKGFFEKGAIDNWVLFGPQSAIPEPQRAGFIKWWRRVMMGGSTTQGSMEVLHPDSRLERISSDPSAWILPDLNNMNAENIATAHQTPLMLLRPEQGSDKAMMDRVTLSWINGVIIPQAQRVIDTLNYQLFDDLGYELVIMTESMNVNMAEEVEKAAAIAQYVAAGETLANAYRILGIDLPDDYEMAGQADTEQFGEGGLVTQERVLNGAQITSALDIINAYNAGTMPRDNAIFMISTFFNLPQNVAEAMLPSAPQGGGEPAPVPMQLQMAQQPPELVEDEQVKSQLWHDDAARLKTWYKKRPDADIAEFKSNELSYLDKLEIVSEMNRDAGIYDWRSYP